MNLLKLFLLIGIAWFAIAAVYELHEMHRRKQYQELVSTYNRLAGKYCTEYENAEKETETCHEKGKRIFLEAEILSYQINLIRLYTSEAMEMICRMYASDTPELLEKEYGRKCYTIREYILKIQATQPVSDDPEFWDSIRSPWKKYSRQQMKTLRKERIAEERMAGWILRLGLLGSVIEMEA